jgi:putative ABC transport system permease protein
MFDESATTDRKTAARSGWRWRYLEAVLVAAFGSAGAVVVLSANSPDLSTLALPAVPMAVILVAGALSGVLAALRPARRAAKLHVLTALATA